MSESLFLEKIDSEIRKIIRENTADFLGQIILEHFNNPGKMLRPKIIYGIGTALQVPSSFLVSWASSCEILHNATLIHDDLQDGDHIRRGQPTTWKKYGEAQAINAGDLLLLCAIQSIIHNDIPLDVKNELTSIFSKMSCRIVNGQSLEFLLKDIIDPTTLEKNYFDCISAKTAALFAESARGVALIAGLSKTIQDKMSDIFDQLGKIFQIQDDILDLYGDKQRDTRGCDLKEGKISFLIVTHLKHHPADLNVVKQILFKPRELTTSEDIQEIERLFTEKETLKKVLASLDNMINVILSDTWLKSQANLHTYVSQIIKKILTPINFLK